MAPTTKSISVLDLAAERGDVFLETLRSAAPDGSWQFEATGVDDLARLDDSPPVSVLVYVPQPESGLGFVPSLEKAARDLPKLARTARHLVTISSSAASPPSAHHPGHAPEDHRCKPVHENPIARRWREFEDLVQDAAGSTSEVVTILRAAPRRGAESRALLGLDRKIARLPFGFDPPVQILSREDLARAIINAIIAQRSGVFNIAPREVIPLDRALHVADDGPLPVPDPVVQLFNSCFRRRHAALRNAASKYRRFSFTVSSERSATELGFRPLHTSAEALREGSDEPDDEPGRSFDDFGMDRDYILSRGWGLMDFLQNVYWRLETRGMSHLPAAGPGVLAGIHRGFMPLDGVMTVRLLTQRLHRVPRFLVHPSLIKMPVAGRFIARIGGIPASLGNARRMLRDGKIVGIFPEGIRGAFSKFRERHSLRKFGRHDFVRLALEHRAPIIPYVIVGSAETFPILGGFEWNWVKRRLEWPYLPLTVGPLPARWHVEFLPALRLDEEYSPETASNRDVVRRISQEVRTRMEEAIERLVRQRRSVFRGSLFEEEDR